MTPNPNNHVGTLIWAHSYLHREVCDGFCQYCKPMTILLKGIFEKITWIIDCHASSNALRIAMIEAPILRIMDP